MLENLIKVEFSPCLSQRGRVLAYTLESIAGYTGHTQRPVDPFEFLSHVEDSGLHILKDDQVGNASQFPWGYFALQTPGDWSAPIINP